MKTKRVIALCMAGILTISAFTGCGNSGTGEADAEKNASGAESGDVEIWNSIFSLPIEKDGALYKCYKELIGVGITQPYVEWNGGSTYQQQLNLKISAGEMPDIFYPANGMEADLIKNGALLDLTDILPEKAPHLWESVPEEVWNIVKSYDPTGEGRIYGVPNVRNMNLYAGLIRKDWLDNLGLEVPTTQDEFVEVLRAFKTEDPNGNGMQDEIPTGGRQEVKWMDQLFAMYGLAMQEGSPDWDIYDGELTYAGVTQNMKDALEFIHELYEEGLIDPETLLNDKAGWEGKINSDKVGVCFHWAESASTFAEAMKAATGTEPNWAVLPVISAPGYEGFYTEKQCIGFQWVVKNTEDEEKIDDIMKVLDAYGNPDLWEDLYYGVDGMHSEVVDGKRQKKPEDASTQENLVLAPWDSLSETEFKIQLLEDAKTEERAWALDQAIQALNDTQQYGKVVAGDGMPSSIYDGYADILNKTLYVEYASKIITGEYEIDKFDEFVERGYTSGGEEVTKAAREWYDSKEK